MYKIFLFLIDPKDNTLKDGVNISDDTNIYEKLSYDTIQVVEVLLKDGTIDADIDLDAFVNGEYGLYDIFIHIKDITSFKLGKKNENKIIQSNTIEQVIYDGEFQDIAIECLELSKKQIQEEEDA